MERSASHAGTSSSRGALPHIAACSRLLPMRCQCLVAEALRLRNPGRVPLPTARGTAKGDGSPSSNGVYLKADEPGARLYFPYNKPRGSSRSTSTGGVSTTTTTTVTGSSDTTSSPTTNGSDSAGSGTVADLLLVSIDSEAQAHDAPGNGVAAASGSGNGGLVATLGILGGFVLLLGGGYLCREPIKMFLDFFVTAVDDWGPWGYLAYAAVYTGLEVLAVPAIPLTMTAGVIFHPTVGTLLVSISGTLAATIAFLIARYAARDKVLQFARRHPRWAAIDRAIGRDGFKFVTLLRLSPLLPLAASNYLYGLTSVELLPYVLGSWIGMLPGTYAYVSAGHVGKAVLTGGEGALPVETWQIALGMSATLLAIGFVGKLAKQAIDEVEQEEKHIRNGRNN